MHNIICENFDYYCIVLIENYSPLLYICVSLQVLVGDAKGSFISNSVYHESRRL